MRKDFQRIWGFKAFFLAAIRREIHNRYLNSGIGVIWLFLNPVLQLFIYYFVFEKIFQIKFNMPAGQGFIAFVAVGLWPWVAFSEGLLAGTHAIDKHKDLLKKMAIPRAMLVLIEVVVPFLIHLLGFVFILLVLLIFFGQTIAIYWLPVVMVVYGLQLLLCFGLSLVFAALQVFLKDVAQALTPIIMVWFYLTPIIYPPSMVPDTLQPVLAVNPLGHFIHLYRELFLAGQLASPLAWLAAVAAVLFFLFVGLAFFRRLSSAFEDVY